MIVGIYLYFFNLLHYFIITSLYCALHYPLLVAGVALTCHNTRYKSYPPYILNSHLVKSPLRAVSRVTPLQC